MGVESKKYFRADLDTVEAFMAFVDDLLDPEKKSYASAGVDVPGVPSNLVAVLRGASNEELRFLASLRDELEVAALFDEYNPRLYYL